MRAPALTCWIVAGWLLQAAPSARAQGRTAADACPPLLNHTLPRLQDEKPQSLCPYAGRVLLMVNTASYCGYTQQFEGLEALNARYAARGLVVMGFPSHDFQQEDRDARKTADLCFNTYGVKFPMFAKTSVRGDNANPLFAELSKASGTRPKWNFYKYLVGRNGQVIDSYSSMTSPDDRDLVRDIEKALAP